MALTQQEQLQHLLNQIEISDDIRGFFKSGALKQVAVSTSDKTWIFYVELDHILPANVYIQLQQNLRAAFINIAMPKLIIQTVDQQINDDLVQQYWHFALDDSELNHAMIQQLESNTELKSLETNHYSIMVGAQLLFNVLRDPVLHSIVAA